MPGNGRTSQTSVTQPAFFNSSVINKNIINTRIGILRHFIYALLILLIASATHADSAASDAAISQLLRSRVATVRAQNTPAPTLRNLTLEQALAQFYAARNDAPAWRDGTRVEQLCKELDNLSGDGLNPEDYHIAELRERYAQIKQANTSAQQIADFDVLASTAYLRSLAHLFRGKVNPATLDPQWNFTLHDMPAADAINIVNAGINSGDIHAVYERARPQNPLYLRARVALAQLQLVAAQGGWPRIEMSKVLKPGESDPQVVNLRKRFLPNEPESAQPDVYDDALVAAVQIFQNEQYLTADGVIGPTTRAALNVPVEQRIDQLRIHLERGRWLFHEFQGDFVLVDIPGYKIYYFKNGQIVWQSQVQVGKPARKSPVFKSKITYITFNPTWTVPPTIMKKDVLPKVRKDIRYLEKNDMRVLDSRGRELDPRTVDWNNPGSIVIRQDAGGDDAALGKVVIRFPNDYSVYLHDTPHRELFENTHRAFSSGCIRVERPFELVELLFNDPEKWNRAAFDQIIASGETRNVNLPKPVPILLAYWTIDLLKNGDIGFKPDIYNNDPAVLKALNARL